MTPAQIVTIQTARKRLGLDEAAYRLVLKNSGKVDSCKDLSESGFRQVMAVFEEQGFQKKSDPTYWRDKITGGGQRSKAERMRYVVHGLMRKVTRYTLPQMVSNISDGATHALDALDNRQLYQLIEALKAIVQRQENAARQGQLFPGEQQQAPKADSSAYAADPQALRVDRLRLSSTPGSEGSAPGAATDGPARTPATVRDDDDQDGSGAARPKTPRTPAARSAPAPSPPCADVAVDTDDDIPF